MKPPGRLLALGYGFLAWMVGCDWAKGRLHLEDRESWFRIVVPLALAATLPLASIGRKALAPLVGWLFLGIAALYAIAGMVALARMADNPGWMIQYWGAIGLCLVGAYLWLIDRKVQEYRDVLASADRLPARRIPRSKA
jgi:hypothetical protein